MKGTKQTAAQKYSAAGETDELGQKIERALELKESIAELKEEYDELKSYFASLFSDGRSEHRIATTSGAAIYKLTNSFSVLPEKAPELKKLLKDAYKDFVVEKTTYGVSAYMKQKLNDGDFKHVQVLREATLIKTTESVDFEPIKTSKARLIK